MIKDQYKVLNFMEFKSDHRHNIKRNFRNYARLKKMYHDGVYLLCYRSLVTMRSASPLWKVGCRGLTTISSFWTIHTSGTRSTRRIISGITSSSATEGELAV